MAKIPAKLRQEIVARAGNRCEYCFAPLFAILSMEVDHIIPLSRGGKTEIDNLCLSCEQCNGHKLAAMQGIDPETGQQVDLYHPRNHHWVDHFRWSDSGTQIEGLTATGRATVIRLHMNDTDIVKARGHWISAGWYPPNQDESPQ